LLWVIHTEGSQFWLALKVGRWFVLISVEYKQLIKL